MVHHKIVVAMPLEEELLKPLHAWGKRFDFSHVEEVHFIHVVKKNITPLEFGLMEMPDENTFKEMVPTIEKFLRDESEKILPSDFTGQKFFHVSSDYDPEELMDELIKKFHADLVVAATRGKHGFQGLFYGSFTDHLVKFAPCDVYVVRPMSA